MSRLYSNDPAKNHINLSNLDNLNQDHNSRIKLNDHINNYVNTTHSNDSTAKIINNKENPIDNLSHQPNISYPTDQMTSNTMSVTNNSSSSSPSSGDSYANWIQLPKMDNLMDAFSIGCSTAVIFGGLIPYIPQYFKIKHSMSSEGFSTYVCLTLLIANILRIAFWFGHHFEMPLLIQSFVMIIGMLVMMEICIRVKDKSSSYIISSIDFNRQTNTSNNRRRSLIDSPAASLLPQQEPALSSSSSSTATVASYQNNNQQQPAISGSYQSEIRISHSNSSAQNESPILNCCDQQTGSRLISSGYYSRGFQQSSLYKWLNVRNFWNWNNFISYIKFLLMFSILLSLLTYLLINNSVYIETLGFVAVFTESMLGMPQLLQNHWKRSTRGMSVEMVIMWLSGDLFKTLYFILRHAPGQFVACGSIQVTVDLVILLQVIWFRRPSATYRKLPKSR